MMNSPSYQAKIFTLILSCPPETTNFEELCSTFTVKQGSEMTQKYLHTDYLDREISNIGQIL